tara:strand:+ start:247 stop:450 length:204 start_codon:yes stop_codon:yes gene_type:complete
LIYNLRGGEIMNAFGITKKSISFFVNMFNINYVDEDNINRYVEVEYRPDDWKWAKGQFKAKNLKKVA